MTAVDRTVPLVSTEFGRRNPDRICVVRGVIGGPWQVWRGNDPLHATTTHADAIRWAQSRAAIDKHPNATRYPFPEPMEAP